ncbi:EamA-like transporter family protein [Arcicella aurantiaca]|uniref:EamA-like transporter family protein n=1 Tax=Arcicella aurantiaca TaxID=591202 RepID=A0A316EH67_9BACT|nr:DMT family transporter [Arcicella aurantiaca]PWK28133.1 EamA-like transporter family protein [Arcicella aurantiaca]
METKNTNQQTISKLQNPTLAWSLLALLAVIWGSSFILVKKSLVVFDASQVGSLRIGAAFLFFLPFVLTNLKKIPFQKAHIFLLVGCLGNLFPAYLFSLAGAKLDSGVSGALNSTTPLFTLIVGGLFFGNKITSKQTIGIVLGFIGALLLILAGAKGLNFNVYALYVVAATVFYGLNLNITKKYLTGLDLTPFQITSFIFTTIGPVALIVLFSGDFLQKMQSSDAIAPLFYGVLLGVMGSAIAMVLFNRLIQMTSAVLASSVTYLIPIVAIIWGIIDGETIQIQHFLGMGIILVGVYLVNKS